MKAQEITFATKKTYKDKEGKERRTYTRIGTLFTNDKGKQSIVLDFIPANMDNGYINVNDIKQKNEQ